MLVLTLAAISGWAFVSGIGVPWPWSDEGATYLALQRSFGQLLQLSHGPDAPLVPYYLLAKAWIGPLQVVVPGLPTLTATRLLSAAAGSLTVVLLYALVARNAGRLAGLLSGLLLVSLPGFDRLAQEARPYTLLAAAATASWLMWDRWLRPRRRPQWWPSEAPLVGQQPQDGTELPGAVGYVASLAVTGLVHTFGLFQWPAQLLASLATGRRGRWSWPRAAVMTLLAMGVAAVMVAAQTAFSLAHGTGSRSPHAARVVNLSTIATEALGGAFLTTTAFAVAPALVLAVVGFVGTRRTRAFSLTILTWLLVPLGLELALAALRTNLFRSRYWIADLPPLAAAAGVGLAVLCELVFRRVVGGSGGPDRPWRRVLAIVVAGAVLGGGLALQASAGAREQAHLRAPRGHHSENLGPILRQIDSLRAQHHGGLPVLISSGPATGILGAARPALETDNPLRQLDPTVATVYTVPRSPSSVRAQVRDASVLLWIFRGPLTARAAALQIPHGLSGLHLRVQEAIPAGGWTAILLRPSHGPVAMAIRAR